MKGFRILSGVFMNILDNIGSTTFRNPTFRNTTFRNPTFRNYTNFLNNFYPSANNFYPSAKKLLFRNVCTPAPMKKINGGAIEYLAKRIWNYSSLLCVQKKIETRLQYLNAILEVTPWKLAVQGKEDTMRRTDFCIKIRFLRFLLE